MPDNEERTAYESLSFGKYVEISRKAAAYDRIVEIGHSWAEVKKALASTEGDDHAS